VVKNFKYHSRGIQWAVRLLQGWGVALQKEDFPEDVPKDDAAFVASLLEEMRPAESARTNKQKQITPKNSTRRKLNHHFQT
jgi:hypothetical protein